MSILLALSPDHKYSARLANHELANGVITSQNHIMRKAYTDIAIFLAQANTKNITKHYSFFSIFSCYITCMIIHTHPIASNY